MRCDALRCDDDITKNPTEITSKCWNVPMFKTIKQLVFGNFLSRDLHKVFHRLKGEPLVDQERQINRYWKLNDRFQSPTFVTRFEPRTRLLQEYMIKNGFDLLVNERIQVLCGRGRLPSNVKGLGDYSTEQLETLGKRLYDFQLKINTIDKSFLSLHQSDIALIFDAFSDVNTSIIPFTKRIQLYDAVVPFLGLPNKRILEPEERKTITENIQDATAVASFYTLVGLLALKYGSRRAEAFVKDEVILGPEGLVGIVSELLLKRRR